MKKLLLLTLLFIWLTGFGQGEKDSLLLRDYKEVMDKSKLMNFLEKKASDFMFMPLEASAKIKADFPAYFNDSIVANSPSEKIGVREYLGLIKGQTITMRQFNELVHRRNGESFLAVLETYGYPNITRLEKLNAGEKVCIDLTIIDRAPEKLTRKFIPLLKKEYKAGNLSEINYEYSMMFAKRSVYSAESYRKFEEKIQKIKEKQAVKQ
jgi:hypothetical protein